MLPTAKRVAPISRAPAPDLQQERAERVRCGSVQRTRPRQGRAKPQQSERSYRSECGEHPLANAKRQREHREVAVLVARDPEQRHGQHHGRDARAQLHD